MKKISPALSKEYSRTILKGGEVLVNVRGTLGGVAVASSSMKGWNVSREVAVIPVDAAKADSDYVAYWIGSDSSQLWLRSVQKGVAYTGINLADLRNLPINLPPIDEQREIVQYIRFAHARATTFANEVERACALLDRLDDATLDKAFRGELLE
jgi:type I restriction enzyme, S subunit